MFHLLCALTLFFSPWYSTLQHIFSYFISPISTIKPRPYSLYNSFQNIHHLPSLLFIFVSFLTTTIVILLLHTLAQMLPPPALTRTRYNPVYFNLTMLFSLCLVHGHHVIHGARSSDTRDGSISPSEDRMFLRFFLWFDLLNTTSINFIYIIFTLKIPP